MIGYSVTSEPLELAFYALAGGAILYVIGEISARHAPLRPPRGRAASCSRASAGGIATDLVVAYGGG